MSKDKKNKYLAAYIPDTDMRESVKRGSPKSDGRFAEIERNLADLQETYAKNQRDQLDSMYNIEPDNLSVTLINQLNSYTTEKKAESIASNVVSEAINSEEGAIHRILAEYATNESVAKAMNTAIATSENAMNIALASYVNTETMSNYVSAVVNEATEDMATTAMISSVTDSNGYVTAASVVAAVNSAGSSVKINADRIYLKGKTLFSDNLIVDPSGKTTSGTTMIAGSNLTISGQFGDNMYDMFQIEYYETIPPIVYIRSPAGAHITFQGNIDFSSATVTGLK